jgi:ATP-dependent DNA helicase RecG
VSTTVVEVGVDVPNASVMVVEHAERFGLSAAAPAPRPHRPRRVGLALHPAVSGAVERRRTRTAADDGETNDGFAIAERDLELRGPGDFFGTRQSGLPKLRTGDLVRDRDIMEEAHAKRAAWSNRAVAGARGLRPRQVGRAVRSHPGG